MYNLEELLNEVIEKYYDITGYTVPSISWSEEYLLSAYGKYDYHTNHISISRYLDTDLISREAIISVILHEIIHQRESEHNAKFNKMFSKLPQNHDYENELKEYFETLQWSYLKEPRKYCNSTKAAYCVLPEEYDKCFYTLNEKTYIDLNCKIINDIDEESIKNIFIIYLIESESMYQIIGWSANSNIYKIRKEIKNKKFGGLDLCYNIQTIPDNCFFLPPFYFLTDIESQAFPATFSKKRIHIVDANTNEDFKYDIKAINEYPGEFYEVGLHNSSIDCISPLKETSIKKLISASKKERKENYMRSLWIANLAVKIEKNYDTILNRADARLYSFLYRLAAVDYMLASDMNKVDMYPVIEAIKSFVLCGDLENAEKYIKKLEKNKFDYSNDKILNNCIKHVKLCRD